MFAESASFEVLAGKPQRVMVGLSTADGRVLQGGSVRFSMHPPEGDEVVESSAGFLPVPDGPTPAGKAKIGRPSQGIGVYAATDVTLPSPGIWTIDILEEGSSGKVLAQTAVQVSASAKVPDVGQPAPPTANPVTSSAVAREILDSRSGPNGMGNELPDPKLHTDVVNDLLRAKRPFVVIASTPAFCQSRFCGPITDVIDRIANEPTSAKTGMAFVHLEVFAEYNGAEKTRLNPWVIPWIDGNGDGHEPWVFVVDRTGKIAARFDNLVSESDLRAAITAAATK